MWHINTFNYHLASHQKYHACTYLRAKYRLPLLFSFPSTCCSGTVRAPIAGTASFTVQALAGILYPFISAVTSLSARLPARLLLITLQLSLHPIIASGICCCRRFGPTAVKSLHRCLMSSVVTMAGAHGISLNEPTSASAIKLKLFFSRKGCVGMCHDLQSSPLKERLVSESVAASVCGIIWEIGGIAEKREEGKEKKMTAREHAKNRHTKASFLLLSLLSRDSFRLR